VSEALAVEIAEIVTVTIAARRGWGSGPATRDQVTGAGDVKAPACDEENVVGGTIRSACSRGAFDDGQNCRAARLPRETSGRGRSRGGDLVDLI